MHGICNETGNRVVELHIFVSDQEGTEVPITCWPGSLIL